MVSIVLLERARSKLYQEIQKYGAETEHLENESIVVEWCRVPDAVYQRLQGDSDQDYEVLASFWSTKGYEFSTPVASVKQVLKVRYSVHDFPPMSSSTSRSYPNPPLSNPHRKSKRNFNPSVVSTVSADASTIQTDASVAGDDSLMLSECTWEGDNYPETTIGSTSRRRAKEEEEVGISLSKRPRHWAPSQASVPPHASLPTATSASITSVPAAAPSASKVSIHRYQLQQVLRCAGCYQVFSRNPDVLRIPVMSQACGHTLCRGCVVRQADEDYALTQSYQNTISCPLCQSPNAFSPELHINHSLCSVIALLDK